MVVNTQPALAGVLFAFGGAALNVLTGLPLEALRCEAEATGTLAENELDVDVDARSVRSGGGGEWRWRIHTCCSYEGGRF